MYAQFGNADALEGYRDPTSDDPDAVRYREHPGQQITTVNLPEGASLQEAFSTAITVMGYHAAEGATPAWVESDSTGLQALLVEHYGITKNVRPKSWGKDTGADIAAPSLGSEA